MKKIAFLGLIILIVVSYGNFSEGAYGEGNIENKLNLSGGGDFYKNEYSDLNQEDKNILYDYTFEFALNCIRLPDILFQANAHFTLGFTTRLNEAGHPIDVVLLPFTMALMENVWDPKEVISCIRKWRFVGLSPRSTYTILLRWEHMKGWVTMVIYSDKMNLYLNLQPDRK